MSCPAAALVRRLVDLRMRRCGFSFGWGCVGAACRRPALRKGLDRAAGDRTGLGARAAGCALGGRTILRLRPLCGRCATESDRAVDLPPF